MPLSRSLKKGFTLLEVLVAVAIMGLVVVGAMHLTLAAQKTLREVAIQRQLLDYARKLLLEDKRGVLTDRGSDKGFSWEVEKKSQVAQGRDISLSYKILRVHYRGRSIFFYMP